MSTGFIGKVGEDEYGVFFDSDMQANKVNTTLFKGKEETGKCVVFISEDSERTMATYLGAAIELCETDLDESLFNGYDYFHVEGYFVQDKRLLNKALSLAKKAGLKISIDLSSYNIVEQNKDYFKEIVEKYVDILFANEDEAEAFIGTSEHSVCLNEMGKLCETAILKLGKDGSMIYNGGKVYDIKSVKTKAVDTTGAGDLFASGFFYGLLNDYSMEICGRLGALLGKNAVEVVGARMDESRWNSIKIEINKITTVD
jgi:sugar/nucleoside kinase (ribokinase family)